MDRKPDDMTLHTDVSDDTGFDLDELLHPAQAFAHPSNVVNDPDLTLKRSGRSSRPGHRMPARWKRRLPCVTRPNGQNRVFDDVMEALRSLDEQAHAADGRAKYKKRLRFTEVTDRLAQAQARPGNGRAS